MQQLVDPGRQLVFSYDASGDTDAHLFGLLGLPLVGEDPWTDITAHPHPSVDDLQLHPIDGPGTRFKLVGCLLARPDAGPLRLVTIDDQQQR